MQGISSKPNNELKFMTVKVKLNKLGGNDALIESSGTFTASDNGIWIGTVGFNVSDLSAKYAILVKGRHHIQRKICDTTPSEASVGIYRCGDGKITLKTGDNELDLSGITLMAGDLDGSGIVDSVDIGLVQNNLSKTDAAILEKADINRDGIVSTQDYMLIMYSLKTRTDEI